MFVMTYMSAEDRRLIKMWQGTEEARKMRKQAAGARKRRLTRTALEKGIAVAQRLAREAANQDFADQDTESEGGDRAAVQSTSGAAAPRYEVASDTSSGRASPAPLDKPSTDPVAVVQHQAPCQAHAWSSMGTDLMVRLEQVALRMRGQRDGRPSTRPVDACELHIAWDRMVRNVDCDSEPGCLFDPSRVSSDDE